MTTKQLTLHAAYELLKNKQISSVELTKSALERIRQVEPKIRALVTITEELALKQAQQADKLIASGEMHTLTGIPGIIKDNILFLRNKDYLLLQNAWRISYLLIMPPLWTKSIKPGW